MKTFMHFREIRLWYEACCSRLGIHPIGPLLIMVTVPLLFAGSNVPGKPCIPEEDKELASTIQLEQQRETLHAVPESGFFPFDFCALQWKLFLQSLDKPRL